MSTTAEIDRKTKCASCGFTRDAHWGPRPIAAPFCTGFVAPKPAPQPAPDAEEEWRVGATDLIIDRRRVYDSEGRIVAVAGDEWQAAQIVRDHSAVPKLVEALNETSDLLKRMAALVYHEEVIPHIPGDVGEQVKAWLKGRIVEDALASTQEKQ